MTADGDLTFPDLPRLELDELLTQLVERAQEVMSTQGRLRGLLKANQALLSDLEVRPLLQRLAVSARELVGARYAALGILDGNGGLAEFIHTGMPTDAVQAIGPLPRGKGLLGAIIDNPQPIRLDDIAAHLHSVGFPPGHPPMKSFLGVPIRIRDEVFGNLYFTDSHNGSFSSDDEELAVALAATAAVVINNARHYETSRRRGDWLAATATITRDMLSTTEESSPLKAIAEHAYRLADADLVAVLLPADPDRTALLVDTAIGGSATGTAARTLIGSRTEVDDTLCGHVLVTGSPVRLDDATERSGLPPTVLAESLDVGPVLVAPLIGSEQARGVLTVARLPGRPPFRTDDLELTAAFANQASVALELAEARMERDRMTLLDERDRIAADLHDHIIQRLFAAGLTLQAVAARMGGHPAIPRITGVIDELDDTIAQIRTTIFAIQQTATATPEGLRARVLGLVTESAAILGFPPALRFSGPVDTLMADATDPGGLADDLSAVLRESLSNVARHAHAGRVEVEVAVHAGPEIRLSVRVSDNGIGTGTGTRRSGLANLRQRAERRGGSFTLTSNTPSGTCVEWSVPVD
ncbi:GAF domain-containing sensor histidine kinase [Paractinoplanes ferrugineus]|uniref:Histidine kinase n=1 Tax=Paractinoplanes ferrugineus TaxID=113564 RepID=A0A919J3J5_9ACTN|nr:GAF domain-containing protein [Actinoplanes ferrugineus]GIE13295.1 histidine kinase [Actinoplanes ferrugineus]